eukprot:COSAG02_NODE_44678_length_364_cov_0.596226_2_plen_49_part_01
MNCAVRWESPPEVMWRLWWLVVPGINLSHTKPVHPLKSICPETSIIVTI